MSLSRRARARSSAAALTVVVAATAVVPALRPPPDGELHARRVLTPRGTRVYLVNPGMGWQRTNAATRRVLPETVPYRRSRYGWAALHRAPRDYRLGRVRHDLRAAAADRKRVALRIATMRGEQWGGHQIPDWVLRRGARLVGGEPDYSSCVYQREWGRFVNEFRRRFDGDRRIAWIDISGYGNFNEWSWQSQTRWEDRPRRPVTLDGHARIRLADMFVGGAGRRPCRRADGTVGAVRYRYRGFRRTRLVMPYAGIQQSSRYVASRRRDVGIRFDCLGDRSATDGFLAKIGDVVAATWRRAPIVFEFCAGDASDLARLLVAAETLQRAHGTAVHDNLVGAYDRDALRRVMRDVGYRLAVREARFPATARAGSRLDVTTVWRNGGVAPPYRGLVRLRARLVLVGRRGRAVSTAVLDADPSRWMPARGPGRRAPRYPVDARLRVPPWLRPGTYRVAVKVADRATGRLVRLAMRGRDHHGRYPLGLLAVTG